MTARRALTLPALLLGALLVGCESAVESPLEPVEPTAEFAHLGWNSVPVLSFADFSETGSSGIYRSRNGIYFSVKTSQLQRGHAYTLWFVVFNDPSQCADPDAAPGCGPTDVVNESARPDMLYGGGGIAWRRSGKALFFGFRQAGDDDGSINGPVGLPAYGLEDPLGAEVHLVVHDHGRALASHMPEMVSTVDGGCTDAGIPAAGVSSPWNDHAFGSRGPNTCGSVQVAVHVP